MMVKYGKKIVLFSLFIMNLVDDPAPEVKIEQGVLSGKISRDGLIFQYVGIPYATTNSSTRFQAPNPPPTWDGVFKAIEEFHMCPQDFIFGVIGAEDCLRINVYVPSHPHVKKPLPVMVYIHGGAFTLGSGGKLVYGPGYIVRKNVILVTFNYRMGLLGFLCLRIKEAPGNAGIKDQIEALRWVNKNIAAFGGDPNNITIFGVSAGATSASLLLISDATHGLFNKAIIQSGSSVSNWSINRKPIQIASFLAKYVGHDTEDPKELYEIFSKMHYKDIISINVKKSIDLLFDTQLLHLPCVEYNIPSIESVITDLPRNIFLKKPVNVDVIYGTTSNEGLLLVEEKTTEFLNIRNGRYLLTSDLKFSSDKEAEALAKDVKSFYFGNDKISVYNALNLSNYYTHLYFEVPAIFEAESLINNNKSIVYNYVFTYSGGRNFMKFRSGFWNEKGASHGDEIFYLFNGDLLPIILRLDDCKIVESITTLWTNFAKFGKPTPESSDLPFKWLPSSKEKLQFLYIDNEMKMGPMLNPEAYLMWKDIYDKYGITEIN